MNTEQKVKVIGEQETELRQAYGRLEKRTRVLCCRDCGRCGVPSVADTGRERDQVVEEGRNVRPRYAEC